MIKGNPKTEYWEALMGDPSCHSVVSSSGARLMLKSCFNFLNWLSDSSSTISSSGFWRAHHGINDNKFYFKQSKFRDLHFYTKYLRFRDLLQQLMYNSFFDGICNLESDKRFRIINAIVKKRDNAIDKAAIWVTRG